MINEIWTGLKPAQVYSYFNVQHRYANIFITFKYAKKNIRVESDFRLPSHGARLLIIHLNKFAEATWVVVMRSFCISKSLLKERDIIRTFEKPPPFLIYTLIANNWLSRFCCHRIINKKHMAKISWMGYNKIIWWASGDHIRFQFGIHEGQINTL